MSGINEDRDAYDKAAKTGKDVTALREEAHAKVLVHLENLMRWRYDWEVANEGMVFEVPNDPATSHTIDSKGQPLYPTLFFFENASIASEILQFNCTLGATLYLGRTLRDFIGIPDIHDIMEDGFASFPKEARPQSRTPLLLPDEGLRAGELSTQVCRCVEYFLATQQSSIAVFPLIASLRMT